VEEERVQLVRLAAFRYLEEQSAAHGDMIPTSLLRRFLTMGRSGR
jgi:hypothetical protein